MFHLNSHRGGEWMVEYHRKIVLRLVQVCSVASGVGLDKRGVWSSHGSMHQYMQGHVRHSPPAAPLTSSTAAVLTYLRRGRTFEDLFLRYTPRAHVYHFFTQCQGVNRL